MAVSWQDQPNLNALHGALLVEELARQGVEHVVIAPGSRSTPLVVAAARNEKVQTHVCVDERAAAFLALGIARGRGVPAAVVTTSGTAVANLAPAVVEASMDRVPLILLTADRPHELRDTGANQTIRQNTLFGDELRWHHELPPPSDRVPARTVLTAAAHAVARAVDEAGPVQINCMFREPLAPTAETWDAACLEGTAQWQESSEPFTRAALGSRVIPPDQLASHAEHLAACESGIIVACRPAPAALALAERLGWPIWADIRSGLRTGTGPPHLPHLDWLLEAGMLRPRAVIQLGSRPTSKRIEQHLDRDDLASFTLVDPGGDRIDPGHRVATRVRADIDAWCRVVADALPANESRSLDELIEADRRVEAAIEAAISSQDASEPWVARWLTAHVPGDHGLFLSSSMPIRDAQMFAVREGTPVPVAANRGASGIDGVIASAAGYAVGLGMPVTLLIGDLALMHDLGSLALLADLPQPVTVVVLNNGGGSIFTMLPVAEHGDVFSPSFDTPHDFHFEGVCRDFGVAHAPIRTRAEMEHAYAEAIARGGASLLEVHSSLEANRAHHREIESAVRSALR